MSSHTDDIVYLVDDEAVVRDALAFLLGSRGLLVYSFASGPALLAHLVQAVRPVRGVFLVDVRMEPMSGLLLHEELLAQGIRNPLLFLSGHGDIPMVVESLKKGAFDFLEKPYSDNTLVDRIEQALAVERAMLVDDARHAEKGARLASLSDREREVMGRVAAGKLNKVIADELHIAVRTVEVHRARVFSKLGVRSAAELATWLAGA
ncbi:MAG TPA: LuxR C-terminal-related transcriptional regulator [Aquabacterium sp.]|uniref:response regulator transcription factor n=1 Tax=Aquabacterium sp. TaxID=1872578 RepID=UPI002E324846|nr:LuxR C-terminal-related transcriptional regulator [Aquabacterium sp.]HEX5374501.1 LuxR C-terminal-related transcriptional regulator [Aquabacterium sp.]